LTINNFKKLTSQYKNAVEKRLSFYTQGHRPAMLREPIKYVLSSGGKRLRAILVLLSCEAVGGKARNAIDAATAIEIFHNFTLVHDDVMDNANKRRGQQTIHKKWDTNVAILVGDELSGLAYSALLNSQTKRLREILNIFTKAFIQVCEGQAFDKEFETRTSVSLNDYLRMIEKKTACLISAATHIGGVFGDGNNQEIKALSDFGKYLGIAFQIMDDLLDVEGYEPEFGKTIGGDIKEKKKTYLMIEALNRAKGIDRVALKSVIAKNHITSDDVKRVHKIYDDYNIIADTKLEIARITHRAQKSLACLKESRAKQILLWLSNQLIERTS
jgi:geranylgeranyl diphosphate synthase, type II